MTPFTFHREPPVKIRSWPTLWKVLACSAASTALAVVLMAWQAHRFCAERHHAPRPLTIAIAPSTPMTARTLTMPELVKWGLEATGKNMVLSPGILPTSRTVTLAMPERMSAADAQIVFAAALESVGLSVVEATHDALRIVAPQERAP